MRPTALMSRLVSFELYLFGRSFHQDALQGPIVLDAPVLFVGISHRVLVRFIRRDPAWCLGSSAINASPRRHFFQADVFISAALSSDPLAGLFVLRDHSIGGA